MSSAYIKYRWFIETANCIQCFRPRQDLQLLDQAAQARDRAGPKFFVEAQAAQRWAAKPSGNILHAWQTR
jgi:hypothetical protein